MKRLYLLLCLALSLSAAYAQNLSISVSGELAEDASDLDAKVYFPKYDMNDNLCALIKVTLTNKLKNPLVLEVGGLGVVAREEKESGEVWFYVPAQVKNLAFKCAEYTAPPLIPAVMKGGVVYRITLNPDAIYETVTNAVLSATYLKLRVNEPNSFLSLGKTKKYELINQNIDNQDFAELLDYGTYYVRVEHPLYETYEGVIVLDNTTPEQSINLTPAYDYLQVKSSPSGATVYIDNKRVGTTPYTTAERLPRGKVSVRLEMSDFHTIRNEVIIKGSGKTQTENFNLKPSFANITFACPDKEAEIWIDQKRVGTGRWSGRLSSTSKHFVETRRAGHRSQSTQVSVVDGETKTIELKAPVALFGTLNVVSSPAGCAISIDGESLGQTTPYIGQLLVGEHTVLLTKDGYIRDSFSVNIEHNKTEKIERTLTKGRLKANVSIQCLDNNTSLYIDGESVSSSNRWDGSLFEGNYVVEARRKGYVASRRSVTIEGNKPHKVVLEEPKQIFGSLTANSLSDSRVYIYSNNDNTLEDYSINSLKNKRMLVGDYKAYATKADYKNSAEVDFRVPQGQLTNIDLPMESHYTPIERLSRWCIHPDSHYYLSKYFAEMTWGGEYVGANVGMFFGEDAGGHLGLHGSFATSAFDTGSEFAVGPLFRLGLLGDVETQIYTGVGYNFDYELPKYELGVRLGIDLFDTSLGLTTLSLGGVYLDGDIFPKFGVSMLPALVFAQDQDDFFINWHGQVFFSLSGDITSSYDSTETDNADECIGFRLAYTPSYLGWYGTLGSATVDYYEDLFWTTGPVVSLTEEGFFSVYGGVGAWGGEDICYEIGASLNVAFEWSVGWIFCGGTSIFNMGCGFAFDMFSDFY